MKIIVVECSVRQNHSGTSRQQLTSTQDLTKHHREERRVTRRDLSILTEAKIHQEASQSAKYYFSSIVRESETWHNSILTKPT